MNNDRGLLSGSITILIGAVIAIMALVRGPWQVWLLLGVFTLWGLWVVLILLLPYMQTRYPVFRSNIFATRGSSKCPISMATQLPSSSSTDAMFSLS